MMKETKTSDSEFALILSGTTIEAPSTHFFLDAGKASCRRRRVFCSDVCLSPSSVRSSSFLSPPSPPSSLILFSTVILSLNSTPALLCITTSQAHFVGNNAPVQLVVVANCVLVVAPLSINGNARSIISEGKLARSALTGLHTSTVLTPSTLTGRHSSRFEPGAQQQRNFRGLWFTSTSPTRCGGLLSLLIRYDQGSPSPNQ
ncbi:Uncharacterized protein Rs2_04092 [Raphanus sativus]|nr:Uncharacterized protein Rs2_04092 [Raphanus sativus]